MLALQDLSYEIGGRWLYQNVNWQITEQLSVGLVGRNGCGKSTLLRIISGEIPPTEGAVARSKSLKLGFLNQDLLSFESDESIFNVALLAFEEELALQREIDELLDRLERDPTNEDLLHELTDKQHRFEQIGGYEIEARTYETLAGLGFSHEEAQRSFSTFSGGWRMRVMLAQMLLRNPDILLLDEPTNHLDLPSIQWVEQYLKTFPGAYIVVSHDRNFLDKVATSIVEVSQRKLHFYTGNYTKFLAEKAERMVMQKAAYDNQQKYIQDTERFIERFKAKATKATQAQSRVKMLEKLDRIEAPEEDKVEMNLRFRINKTSGQDVLKLKHVYKAYDKTIFEDAEAVIYRGDKIGLVGANGAGKSTLLRIVANTEPFEGERKIGYQVEETFFAQHQLEALNLENSIWNEAYNDAPNKTDGEIRNILGCFLFSGDDIEKPIKVLSGGEKSRVALAKTLMREANFMLLDEPTNHLDMQSIEILANALKAYDGTYILVSHDRFFLSKVTNKIWYIEDKGIKEYPGSYDEYEDWQRRKSSGAAAQKAAKPKKAEPEKKSENGAKQQSKPSPDRRKEAKKLQNQIQRLEKQIEEAESKKEKILLKMASPDVAGDYEELARMEIELKKSEELAEGYMNKWEELALELEELTA